MARPHLAALVEDAWNRRKAEFLRGRGWGTRVVAYTGYGNADFARVLARLLMTRDGKDVDLAVEPEGFAENLHRTDHNRGWRAFVTAPAFEVPITVTIGDQVISGLSDRSGLIDLTTSDHGLEPGWHTATVSSADAADQRVPVMIVGAEPMVGLVSDIDDTVLATMLPRPLIAAWNTFIRHESARHPVPGMATFYRRLLTEHPSMPVVYISTGAWNTAPTLMAFLRRNGFPLGPMLLTDWGPTNTGWFRSGQDHKRSSLARLVRELPNVSWLLVGDDGQHDPRIYTEFAARSPDAVQGIAIRQLSPGEQVLSHGIPLANDQLIPGTTHPVSVPVVRAPNGYGLAAAIEHVIGGGDA